MKGDLAGLPSNRYYLADADFLVGLEGDDEVLLCQLDAALRSPAWQISLGRKSFLPSVPVYLPGAEGGVRPLPLEAALAGERWPLRPLAGRAPAVATKQLRLVLETSFAGGARPETRNDQPIGAAFDLRNRSMGASFGLRPIVQTFAELENKEHRDVPQPAHA